ncbi:short-chain dehydrogenase [Thalassobacillus devorans]|uniref:Short-chain dehydrogenase n=1 Tax=Thalassobacillus devorans TaxID=279813 RepID=A0ABQ1P567_9BACI|nr:SDR family NAD(P)-dependent oxidoreductase [Thalassobacillus devorans]NIK28044.1 NAD(P)-dependent dehydrogenase (short-subunit alcohol dehydrogenase family) [Thalassobacillus devorans]GGC89317.1 short-chain dehydrogenase [Thalassobacillus devorans]
MRLKNKVAIITGAGSGQGKEAAKIFAAEGAHVVIAEWNEDNGKSVEKEILNTGHKATFIKTDISDENNVKELVEQVISQKHRIDILFNNAGIGFSSRSQYKMASVLETPLDDWNNILSINLNGTYLMCKHVLPIMIEQQSGNIVNNSSLNGILGVTGADAYTASKGGVVALSRVMAVDYGKYNIRVNCICPGAIDTPMIQEVLDNPEIAKNYEAGPLGRVGKPEEVAQAALFLASEESSYITGLIMPVDGGWSVV